MKLIEFLRSRLSTVDWKSKFKAFAVHISISLIIFIVLLYLILVEWYPFPFFNTDGGLQGMRLVFFIDMVLGPTLTFVVFKIGKPRLAFDLAVIAILQFSALGWGVWSIHHERPAAMVFTDDRFIPIPYYQVSEAGLSNEELKKLDTRHPARVIVDIPDENDPAARATFFQQAFSNQKPIFLYGDRFKTITNENKNLIVAKSIDVETYLKQDFVKEQSQLWNERFFSFKTKTTYKQDELIYLAFYARHGRYILVLHRDSLEYIEILDIKPPQSMQKKISARE